MTEIRVRLKFYPLKGWLLGGTKRAIVMWDTGRVSDVEVSEIVRLQDAIPPQPLKRYGGVTLDSKIVETIPWPFCPVVVHNLAPGQVLMSSAEWM